MKLLGIEVTPEEFNNLFCEQSKGKEIKVVDGKVVAVERELTQQKQLERELSSLYDWFDEYDNQVKQYERCQRLGVEFDKNIEELDAQATINQKRIAEIRNLLKGE